MDKIPDKPNNKELLNDISHSVKVMLEDTKTIKSDLSYIKSILKIGEKYNKPEPEPEPQNYSWW